MKYYRWFGPVYILLVSLVTMNFWLMKPNPNPTRLSMFWMWFNLPVAMTTAYAIGVNIGKIRQIDKDIEKIRKEISDLEKQTLVRFRYQYPTKERN